MPAILFFAKSHNKGYTYLRRGKLVTVQPFDDSRTKRGRPEASGKDDQTLDLFGEGGGLPGIRLPRAGWMWRLSSKLR